MLINSESVSMARHSSHGKYALPVIDQSQMHPEKRSKRLFESTGKVDSCKYSDMSDI